MVTFGPMTAYGPTATSFPSSAPGSMMAVGWIMSLLLPAPAATSSTIDAVTSAFAATASSTFTSPCIFQTGPLWAITSISIRSWSPGTTGRRNLTLSIPAKYAIRFPPPSAFSARIPPTWAMDSTIRTPGMIGCPGNAPGRTAR